jgi:hypothetical protein
MFRFEKRPYEGSFLKFFVSDTQNKMIIQLE